MSIKNGKLLLPVNKHVSLLFNGSINGGRQRLQEEKEDFIVKQC